MYAYIVLMEIIYSLPIVMMFSLTAMVVLLRVWPASHYRGRETSRATIIYTAVGGCIAATIIMTIRDAYAGEGKFPSIPLVNIAIATLILSFFVFRPMIVELYALLEEFTKKLNTRPSPHSSPIMPPQDLRASALENFKTRLSVPAHFKEEVTNAFVQYLDKYSSTREIDGPMFAVYASNLFAILPKIFTRDIRNGISLEGYFETASKLDQMRAEEAFNALREMGDTLKLIPVAPTIPHDMRVEHHQIVANPGHGKTTTLMNMILRDLQEDCAIVVIDSQGDMIRKLATRVPLDRLILIDPATCPPALNMFDDDGQGDNSLSDALELYTYIFSSSGQALTGRQATVYKALCRLCMAIPGATMHTLLKMLGERGALDYVDIIAKLGPTTQSFFERYNAGGVYKATKEEIGPRIDTILEEGPFGDMVGASRLGINMFNEINAGKVILINTNATLLKAASPIFGRFFIGQVMQTVRKRQEGEKFKRCYLYVDEFGDYADESKMVTDCFTQGRKYGLAMVVCFQLYGQLPLSLRSFISTCTAIKFAGGITDDRPYMAKQMNVDEDQIRSQPKGTFLAYFKDLGVMPWKARFGYIDTVPELHTLKEAIEQSRRLYGDRPKAKDLDDTEDFKEGW